MYVIPFYKVANSKPENLIRLAKAMGVPTEGSQEELVGRVHFALHQPVGKSSAQRQAYEDFWAKQPTTLTTTAGRNCSMTPPAT